MATVIGYDESVYKTFTCISCGGIVRYAPGEVRYDGNSLYGVMVQGVDCPGCKVFHRLIPGDQHTSCL